jgi:opacity protein-like surface antigen
MAKSKALILAGGALLALTRWAAAADLLPPPPVLEPLPPAVAEFSGWYLRGDIGVGINATTPSLINSPDPIAIAAAGYYNGTPTESFNNSTISSSAMFDLGVGYQVNNWFRFDVTGEYRGGSHFQSQYVLNDAGNTGTGPSQLADFYRGDISSWVGLVNGYADLGTWSGITPYVGAGVGLARNTLSGMTDQGQVTIGGATSPSGGYFSDGSQTNFAWALMAGLDFNVTQNLKLEIGYRYLNLGKFTSGGSNCLTSCNGGVPNYVKSTNTLASNDVRVGLRWMIGESSYAPPPEVPLIRKY